MFSASRTAADAVVRGKTSCSAAALKLGSSATRKKMRSEWVRFIVVLLCNLNAQ